MRLIHAATITTVMLAVIPFAHGYSWCQYKPARGLKCTRIAINGGKYCKEHTFAATTDPAERRAMEEAARYAAKWNREGASGETHTIMINGKTVVVGKDGRLDIQRQPPGEEATVPQTSEEKMEWHFRQMLKYMKEAINEAEERGVIKGQYLAKQEMEIMREAESGQNINGKTTYVP